MIRGSMEFWTDNSVKVPKLGFGTYMLKGKEAVLAIRQALDTGFRHIDTAQIYSNEAEVGEALRQSSVPRENIFLTTKIWRDTLSPKDIKTSFHESLRCLKTDYTDLLLIHWPNPAFPLKETLRAFKELRTDSKIRHIGVSNFPCALLKQAEQLCPDLLTNQAEYHPLLSQKKILSFMENRNMFLTAYSPLMRGKVIKIRQIADMGEKYGKSPAQISLRWLVGQKNVVAIVKAQQPRHIKENFNVFDFDLEERDNQRLFRLTNNSQRLIDPPFAPEWDS